MVRCVLREGRVEFGIHLYVSKFGSLARLAGRPPTPFCGLVALQGDELQLVLTFSSFGLESEVDRWRRASEQMHFLALDLGTAKLHTAKLKLLSVSRVSKKALPFR